MRGAAMLLALLALAGCNDQPDFDTRYDEAAKDIEARAKAMEDDIAETDRAAAAETTEQKID